MHPLRLIPIGLCAGAILALGLPSAGAAQTLHAQCGGISLDAAEWDLGRYRDLYVDPELEWLRQSIGVQELDPDAPSEVITAHQQCRPIIRDVLAAYEDVLDNQISFSVDSFNFSILRYGPYITVPLSTVQDQSSGIWISQPSKVFVMVEATSEILGWYFH